MLLEFDCAAGKKADAQYRRYHQSYGSQCRTQGNFDSALKFVGNGGFSST
jgi:hypothetical protein